MSAYQWTVTAIDTLNKGILDWTHQIFADGGLSDIPIWGSEFPPEHSALVMIPEDIDLWPKASEVVTTIPMLGRLQRDQSTPIPGIWHELAEAMVRALEQVFPFNEGKGNQPRHLAITAPVDTLPAPLRAWYRSQGETPGSDSWLFKRNDTLMARLPTVEWLPGPMVRIRYMCFWHAMADSPKGRSPSLVSLATLIHGLHAARQLPLFMPPAPAPTDFNGFLDALAESASGDEGRILAEKVHQARGPTEFRISLAMLPELNDMPQPYVGHYEWPSPPILRFTAILPLGGGPIFMPAVGPSLGRLEPGRRGGA